MLVWDTEMATVALDYHVVLMVSKKFSHLGLVRG